MRCYSKRFTVYYYPPVTGFNINPAFIVHHLNSLGSILARRHFRGAHMPHQATITFASLLDTHSYTWVESSNVDKMSCWRTKSVRHWRESNSQPFYYYYYYCYCYCHYHYYYHIIIIIIIIIIILLLLLLLLLLLMIWQSPGLPGWRKVNFITVTRRPHHPK